MNMVVPFMAMENPGIVTCEEHLIEPYDTNHSAFRHYIMTHEMAHMWFGNQTYVPWWGETFLKETFADYTAFVTEPLYRKLVPES